MGTWEGQCVVWGGGKVVCNVQAWATNEQRRGITVRRRGAVGVRAYNGNGPNAQTSS